MKTRFKAVTLLVLVSFLYTNVIWAIDLKQPYKLASRSSVPHINQKYLPLIERLASVIRAGKIQETDLPSELQGLYRFISPKKTNPLELTPDEAAIVERYITETGIELLQQLLMQILPDTGALIGKIVSESGEIITEYITGEVKGGYLVLRDKRKTKGKPVAKIRCSKEPVKEEMTNELTELLKKSKVSKDSIEYRYISAIIEYSMSESVGFYVLKSDVRNIYGFANGDIFCLYEPFLSIPAAFFHEAGESFFLSNNYRAFLSQEMGHSLTDDEWLRHKGKARLAAGSEEVLIPAHTYLRGIGKKARAKGRELIEAERLLPNGKGLEDLVFGEENITVSRMIREQKEISQALRKLEGEDWVKGVIPELQKYTKLSNEEILSFLRELIQIQSVSKLLDLLLDRLNKTNLNLLECIKGLDDLLNILLKHIPYTRVRRIMDIALGELRKPIGETGLEKWRKNTFIMKALVRFFKRIKKAELHHHLDGAISPDLILKVLCLFPEAREQFVRNILGEKDGSVNEVFSNEVGGPRDEKGWERLQYSLQYLFSGRTSQEDVFMERFGGAKEYNKAIRVIKKHLEYRPTEIGTVNIIEFLKKFGLTGLTLYCNPEALRIVAREATIETYQKDNTVLIEQKMHNLTFGYPLSAVVEKVLQGLREAESVASGNLVTGLTMCVFKNPELVLGGRYEQVVKLASEDNRSIEAIKYKIWQEIEYMIGKDFSGALESERKEKEELDNAIAELGRMVKRRIPNAGKGEIEKEVKKRLLIFWEERKEGIRQVREIIKVKQKLALNYPDLAQKLTAIDTVGSEVDYITWVHSYGLRLAKKYGFRIIDHAGESWPEEDIWQALNRVKGAIETGVVERIGHATCLGIHPEALRESRFPDGSPMYTLDEIGEIEKLQQRILGMMKERNIVLETNPSSNLLLLPKYITSYKRHPIQYFWRRLKGLLVASSDDPHILHTIGLSGEFSKVWLAHPKFKFGELMQIIRNGFQHTFLKDGQGPALAIPLWDGVTKKEQIKDLRGYHPSSIVNRVRDFTKWLPVLDYQMVGEYPRDLIELEQSLTLYSVGWEKVLSGEYGGFATPAGMPAINIMLDAAIDKKVMGRDAEIILIEPPYGCTKNLMDRLQRTGYKVHSITVDQVAERLPGLINDKTGIIYLESVANPNLMVPSIEFILRENRGRAVVLVDDTFATPEMIRSLEIEADGYSVDMSMLGLTKGTTGTGNIISGAVVAKREWYELLAKRRNCLPEEQEIKRAKRGLRYMAIRFNTQSRNAGILAGEVDGNDLVSDIVYPKDGHMLYYVYKKLCNAIDNINLLAKFRTMINAVSLGQVRNLFERPSGGTHFTVGEEARRKGGISAAGIRGSIGIETKEDVVREIRAMLEIISIYNDAIPKEDMEDINKIFMAESVTQEEGKRTVRYLLPKWAIPHQTFSRLISDLGDAEKERLRDRYGQDERFRRVVDILIKATEITECDPVNIAIHHRLIWCILSGDHNSVIASPIESTTTHKQDDTHMEETFLSILAGKKKGLPPIGNYTLYSRLGKPGIASFELLMALLEVGAEKALYYDYIATSFYTERMAQLAFLGQQAEIIIMNAMMEKSGKTAGQIEEMRQKQYDEFRSLQEEVLSEIRRKELEIIIVTPRESILATETIMADKQGILKFRIINPEDIESEVSSKTIMVYFDNLRIRGFDPVKIRDIVKGKNSRCIFGITDSFNLGYEDPRPERDFDFITHVIYYENADKGAVIIAKNDKPLMEVWNNPFWSRKNRGTAMSEDNAVEMLWYVLPYLRVFDSRYDVNIEAVTGVLSEAVKVVRIDKRNLELEFKSAEEKERFLALAWDSNLISASNFPLPAYFCVNEWTSIRPKDKVSNSLILQVGIEETGDLLREFNIIISKLRTNALGAIGKGSCLAEKDKIVVEELNDGQREIVRQAIDKIKAKVNESGLGTEEKRQAEEVISLLEAWSVYVFDAIVEGPEDYLLAFPRERDHIIALARDFLDPDYIIQFHHRLPEIFFHEGFTARFGERDYGEHRRIYQGIQRKIFGEENWLADELRFYINLKLPGEYAIEFDQKTSNDKNLNINIDRIRRLLQDKEFVYKTLERLYEEYKFMLPHIRIANIKVEHGGTGSRKQTLHISFMDGNTGFKWRFALKVAINKAARYGFAKGVKDEIPTLRELSGKCEIPKFGIYIEEPENNFYAYTERWIHGPTAARIIAKKKLAKERLVSIVNAYLSVMKAMDTRSKTGGYLGIYDVQTENVMFESWESNDAIAVDIGKIDYIKPLFILQEFDRHYSKGNTELHEAIFDGVIGTFGVEKGLEFLEAALDATSSDNRKQKGFSREMVERLTNSLKRYVRRVYMKTAANEVKDKLEKLSFMVLDRLSNKEDPAQLLNETNQWIENLYRNAQEGYTKDMSLSKKTRLEVIELVLKGISTLKDLLRMPPSLDQIEKLLDISFLLGFITGKEDVILLEKKRPILNKQARLNVLFAPKETLDALDLKPEDVYLSVGAGTGIYNIAACLRGVRESIYIDISESNLPFVARLKKHYDDIVGNPGLRDELENHLINNVVDFITKIMRLKGETVKVDEHLPLGDFMKNPNLFFGETDLPQDALKSTTPPLTVHIADTAHMPLLDDSVTKVSVVGLLRWVHEQGGNGKVIHAIKEILRVTKTKGIILHRVHNPVEKGFIDLFPKVATAMGITLRLKEITKLGEQVFEVVSKNNVRSEGLDSRKYLDRINGEWQRIIRGAPPIDLISKKLVKALMSIKKEIGGDCNIRIYPGPDDKTRHGGIYRNGQPILLVKAEESGVSAISEDMIKDSKEYDWEWLEEHLPKKRLEDYLKGPEPLEKLFLFKFIYNEFKERLNVNTNDKEEEDALSTAMFYIAKFGATSYENSKMVAGVFEEKFGLKKTELDKEIKIQLLIAIYAVANHDAVEYLDVALDVYQRRFELDLRNLDRAVRLQLIKSSYVLAMKNWRSLEDIFNLYEQRFGFNSKKLDKETILQLLVSTCEVGVKDALGSLDKAISIYEAGLGLNLKQLSHRVRLQLIIATYTVAIKHAEDTLQAVIDEKEGDLKNLDEVDKINFIRRSYNIATAKVIPEPVRNFYKSGDLRTKLLKVIKREFPWLDLDTAELHKILDSATPAGLLAALRGDDGRVDKEDIIMAEKIAKIVDRFSFSGDEKFKLIQILMMVLRQKKTAAIKEKIRQQISQYDTLKDRIRYDDKEVKYVFIDKECLPAGQQYVLSGREWEKRKQLLEKLFQGYRFNVFAGALEPGMNKDNTIVLTNKDIEIEVRLLRIQNSGQDEYFPIDALMFLSVGLLNLSTSERDGSPLVSTVTRIYKEIAGVDIDVHTFLDTYKLSIILPPIGKFSIELQSYAISLLEQAA